MPALSSLTDLVVRRAVEAGLIRRWRGLRVVAADASQLMPATAALQILAIAQAIAAVCALRWARIHRFHFMQLSAGQDTLDLRGAIPAFIHISDGKLFDVNVLDCPCCRP